MTHHSTSKWPIVGREATIEQVLDARAAGHPGRLIVGPPGVGRSTVLAAVADRVERLEAQQSLFRLRGNPALSTVAFGALSEATELDWKQLPIGISTAPSVTALADLLAAADARVLVVDDVHLVDPATLAVLDLLASRGEMFVVASAPTPLHNGTSEFREFVGRRELEQIELGRLSHGEVALILKRRLGGRVADAAVTATWSAAAGNALYVRELTEAALAGGSLRADVDGLWHLAEEFAGNPRIADLLAQRLRQHSPAAVELFELLAVAERLRRDDVTSAANDSYAPALDELEHAGLVVTITDGPAPVVAIAHPIDAEIVGSSLGAVRRRRLLELALQLVGPPRSDVDDVAQVSWLVELGRAPHVDTLRSVTRVAIEREEWRAVRLLADAAWHAEPSFEMARFLADALMRTGQADAAEKFAQGTMLGASDSPTACHEWLQLVGLRLYNLLWHLHRPDRARVVIDDVRARLDDVESLELLTIHEAYVLAFEGDADGSLAVLEAQLAWSDRVAPQGWSALCQALVTVGRCRDAVAVGERAVLALGATDSPALLGDRASIALAYAHALVWDGRFDLASAAFDGVLTGPRAATSPFLRALALVGRSRLEMFRGDVTAARDALAEAAAAAATAENVTVRAIAIGELAAASGQASDGGADDLLAELESFDLPHTVGHDELARGTAWLLAARLDPAAARRILRDSATSSEARAERVDALLMLVDAARLGGAAEVRADVASLAHQVTGTVPQALIHFVDALASGRVGPLVAVVDELTELGMMLLAAEAAFALAREHRRAGDGRAADVAIERAQHLAGQCRGAGTPGLLWSHGAGGTVPLTNREREVATLAAAGLTNRAIAERLGMAPRTAGNHLQSAFTKLGVTSRQDLGALLGD
ncbi:MAG TPA: helix-turn-helix transcriptional regulator [Ilumatobacter sp.]|nr:helix-turn-helix transcriptional regulator [Ilumatobacter sp.]